MAGDRSGKSDVLKTVAPLLKIRGWRKKGANWLFQKEGAGAVVFGIQKSAWSCEYYLNFGVFLPGNATTEPVAAADADVSGRCEHLLVDDCDLIRALCYDPHGERKTEELGWFCRVLSDINLEVMESLAVPAKLDGFLKSPSGDSVLAKPDLAKQLSKILAAR